MTSARSASLIVCVAVLGFSTSAASAAPASFSAPTQYAGGGAVATGDFNRDGHPDLAIANHDAGVLVRFGTAGGGLGTATTYPIPTFPGQQQPLHAGDVKVADFNGDHDPDLLVMTNVDDPAADAVTDFARLLVYPGGPGGTFGAPVVVGETPIQYFAVAVGDFNGDGDPDLASSEAAESVDIALGGPGFTFTNAGSELAFGFRLDAADFNHDAKDELISGESSGDSFLVVQKDPFAGPRQVWRVDALAFTAGDFNRDGNNDLVATGATNAIFIGSASGQLADPVGFDAGACCGRGLVAADFNRDGNLDLAATNAGATRNVSVIAGNGHGAFAVPLTFLANGGDASLVTADFNGDHKPDLAVANGSRISILLNTTGQAPSYRDRVLNDEPVSYWRFGESSGTTVADETGDNPGRYQGGYTLGKPGVIAGNSAVQLDGRTGYVRVPDTASLHTGDSFSLELWLKRIKLSTDVSAEGLFSKGFQLYLDPNGQIVLRKPGPGGREIARSTTRITDTTQFHHVVATKSGSSVRIYIDGVNVTGPVTNATIADTDNVLAIGAGAGTFRGIIDEAALYNHPLTAAQIAAHHNAGH